MNKTADGSPVDPNTPPFSQALPVNVTLPVVTGPSPPVVGSTLQSSPGVWNYNGLKLAYQWLRASSPIAGATGTSYTTVTADKTNTISCMVTATNAKGTTPATSAATVAVP
jgi:hypothetical protein